MRADHIVGENLEFRLVAHAGLRTRSSRALDAICPSVFCACGRTMILPWKTPLRRAIHHRAEEFAAHAMRHPQRQTHRRRVMMLVALEQRCATGL